MRRNYVRTIRSPGKGIDGFRPYAHGGKGSKLALEVSRNALDASIARAKAPKPAKLLHVVRFQSNGLYLRQDAAAAEFADDVFAGVADAARFTSHGMAVAALDSVAGLWAHDPVIVPLYA